MLNDTETQNVDRQILKRIKSSSQSWEIASGGPVKPKKNEQVNKQGSGFAVLFRHGSNYQRPQTIQLQFTKLICRTAKLGILSYNMKILASLNSKKRNRIRARKQEGTISNKMVAIVPFRLLQSERSQLALFLNFGCQLQSLSLPSSKIRNKVELSACFQEQLT